MIKQSVLSLSGGMDSSTLLLRMLADGYKVTAISFDYDQKHKVELERAKQLVDYINWKENQIAGDGPRPPFWPVEHHVIRLEGLSGLLHSTLVTGGEEVPEGHYEEENMKATVVPNRNKIFASIIQAAALSIADKTNEDVMIGLGIHSGDHCFSKDTNILTPTGLKTVEMLDTGDQIYSYNLETNKWELDTVTQIVRKNVVDSINKITTYAGDIKLTDEHKIYRLKLNDFHPVYGYSKSIEKVKVRDLTEDDLIIQPTGIQGIDVKIDKIDLSPIARKILEKYKNGLTFNDDGEFIWLGGKSEKYKSRKIPRQIDAKSFVNILAWYIAEGWSQKTPYEVINNLSRYSAQFCQSLKANLEKVELIEQTLRDGQIPVKREFSKTLHNKIPKEVTFYISNIMSIFMKECGSHPQIKHIPGWLMGTLIQNNELREEFLYTIGLADGFNTETLYRGFCSTSEKLIEQVIILLQLSGYHFTKQSKNTKTQYITYSKLGQKAALISLGHAKFTKVRTINKIPYGDHVYDITVENNHNFSAGEYGSILISNSIYPDCRQDFRDADYEAFRKGNWNADKVKYFTPYLDTDKLGILKDGEKCISVLGLDFNEVYKRTITSYKPTNEGYSDFKSASSVERIEAFINLGKPDPIQYGDGYGRVDWNIVKVYVKRLLETHNVHKS